MKTYRTAAKVSRPVEEATGGNNFIDFDLGRTESALMAWEVRADGSPFLNRKVLVPKTNKNICSD